MYLLTSSPRLAQTPPRSFSLSRYRSCLVCRLCIALLNYANLANREDAPPSPPDKCYYYEHKWSGRDEMKRERSAEEKLEIVAGTRRPVKYDLCGELQLLVSILLLLLLLYCHC